MKSPSTLTPNSACAGFTQHQSDGAGFTLIEILVVMAIVSFVATFGIITGLDTYARYNFHSELDDAASMLERARSEAINNIGGAPHGVCFNDPSDLIVFQGASCTARTTTYDLKIPKAKTAVYSGASEIVFSQLSGEVTACNTPCVVTINDGVRNSIITINNEGGINW